MRLKKSIMTFAIVSLFALSMISTAPPAVAAAKSLEDALGHSFDEEYWSVIYDFAGEYRVQDFNPGAYNSSLGEGKTDNNTGLDVNCFGAWVNIDNVQTLYVACQNISWNVANSTLYGCAPYQLSLTHFAPPNQTDIHIFATNMFFGLLAWRDNLTDGTNGIPDANDSLYMGWAYYSELHKFLVNLNFWANGVNKSYHIDNSSRGYADPIPLTKTTTTNGTTYKYGMSYKNIFILWQKIEVQEGLDDGPTVDGAKVVNNCSAFGILDEINFTFIISRNQSAISPNITEVTTTTEYDIGRMSHLWVVGDNATVAQKFSGYNFTLNSPSVNMSYYNTTNNGVGKRLQGNATELIPGFGLAVINHANLIILNVSAPWLTYAGEKDFVDFSGTSLGASDKSISSAMYNVSGQPAYKIDFASKPKYIFNGVTELDAPTRVLRNNAIADPMGILAKLYLIAIIAGYIWNITQPYISEFGPLVQIAYGIALVLSVAAQLTTNKFFYLTCFPTWNGATISQDPTFTAYVDAPESTTDGGGKIPGYEPLIVGLVSIAGVTVVFMRIRKKKKLRIS
jgi:hypothetical protein